MLDKGTMKEANGLADPTVIAILGSPGAGKGTLSAYLAERYSLAHLSVGDILREWKRENRHKPLAATIQDRLDNQGFLNSEELNPLLRDAVVAATKNSERKIRGTLFDGYPRCIEQSNSLDLWPLEDVLPRHHSNSLEGSRAPDMVIVLRVSKANAKARYVGRMRDARDSVDKFEKRFAEYETETAPVEAVYRERGLLVEVDANGTKEENFRHLEEQLRGSPLWTKLST